MIETMDYRMLECHPYCLAIPEMTDQEFAELKEDISGSGLLEPIVLFEGMILDGRHRFRACMELEIEPWFKPFDGPDSACDYVISKNLRRRNLNEGQRAAAMTTLARLERGGNAGVTAKVLESNVQICTLNPPTPAPLTRKQAAEIAGVGEITMARAMQVDRRGAPEVVKAVSEGKVSVAAAAKMVKELPDHADQREVLEKTRENPRKVTQAVKEHKEKPKPRAYITLSQWQNEKMTAVPEPVGAMNFNRQDDTAEDSMGNIEWAAWSWNPVTGCKHDCSYCYARDIAGRFYPQGFEPSIHPDRLTAPYTQKVPKDADIHPAKRNVFANSMSDLYGRWVPQEWIDAVFKAMADNPQWNFLTLTKFPKRAAELVYPANVWIGTSVDLQARVKAAEEAFSRIECGVRWLSIEPMIEPLTFSKPELFDWVVIGGASKSSQTPEWTPPFSWIVRVASQFLEANPDVKIYLKTNGRPREFPGVITQHTAHESFRYLGK
jgi:protein gp37